MAMINKDYFKETMPSELALFDLPPCQVGVKELYYEDIRPLSASTTGPIDFTIATSNSSDYLNLKNTQLYVKLKVLKANGQPLGLNEKTGPVNLFLQAVLESIQVTLQNKVTLTCYHNPYKAMINVLLNMGQGAKETQLTTQLFEMDEADGIADCDTTGSNNGLFIRSKFIEKSKSLDMVGNMFHDLFTMDRYLLNQVDVKVRLNRTSPAFSLSSGETSPDYKIEFQDIFLRVQKARVNPGVIVGHNAMLQTTNAKYPFTRTEVKLQSIPTGTTNYVWPSMFVGKRPNRVVVGFVDARATAGDYKRNPFNFETLGIRSITLYVDGLPVNGKGIKMDLTNTAKGLTYAEAYANLFEFTGKWGRDAGNFIHKDNFLAGCALFAWSLEPYFPQHGDYLTLVQTGNVQLSVEFGTALTATYSIVVLSEEQSYFEIDKQRDIIVE